MTAAPCWRPARCEECGDRIEVNEHGERTLCACDATPAAPAAEEPAR